jgi:hypothetical protein
MRIKRSTTNIVYGLWRQCAKFLKDFERDAVVENRYASFAYRDLQTHEYGQILVLSMA